MQHGVDAANRTKTLQDEFDEKLEAVLEEGRRRLRSSSIALMRMKRAKARALTM